MDRYINNDGYSNGGNIDYSCFSGICEFYAPSIKKDKSGTNKKIEQKRKSKED